MRVGQLAPFSAEVEGDSLLVSVQTRRVEDQNEYTANWEDRCQIDDFSDPLRSLNDADPNYDPGQQKRKRQRIGEVRLRQVAVAQVMHVVVRTGEHLICEDQFVAAICQALLAFLLAVFLEEVAKHLVIHLQKRLQSLCVLSHRSTSFSCQVQYCFTRFQRSVLCVLPRVATFVQLLQEPLSLFVVRHLF